MFDRTTLLLIASIAGRDPRTVAKALRDPNSVAPIISSAVARARVLAERQLAGPAATEIINPPNRAA